MTGVIYARYSSENQRDESIDGQIRECIAFAEKNGITIVEHYIDRAISARTDNRPDFQRMIRDSHKKKFDVVIVWKLDRFARSREDSAKYRSILRLNGTKLVSATESIPEGYQGIFLESILEGMAEYYSAELSEKVNRGLTENALHCKFNGGMIPLGYNINKEQFFEIDPVTAPVVLEIFQKYIDGMTIKEIADDLNARGIHAKKAKSMNVNSVSRILQNRRYIGEYRFKDIVTENGIPAIVPKQLFDDVQKKLAKNKRAPARHKAEDDYLLTTKLFCGDCKSFMVGEIGTSHMKQKKYRYYKCVSAKKRKGCHKKAVRKEWIENIVIEQIRKFIFDDEAIEKLIKILLKEQDKENTTIPVLKRELKIVEKKIENLITAIEDGVYTPTTKARLEELEVKKEDIEILITKEEYSKPKLTAKQIKFFIHKFRKLDTTKLEHRKILVDSFLNGLVLYDDRIDFYFNYKDGTQTITLTELESEEKKTDKSSNLVSSAQPNKKRLAPASLFLLQFSNLCCIM